MGLTQLISVVWFFIREMLFDSKDEYNINSKKFNARRVTIALLLMFLLITEVFMLVRAYGLASEVLILKDNLHKLEQDCKKSTSSLIE